MSTDKQSLLLLFDGTWNDPEDRTNVYRFSRSLADTAAGCRQRFLYDPGVGTSRLDRFRGGVFGYGLSENLMQGYEWLAKRHAEGDSISVLGFSRGAYTARSLVGMISKCGLLDVYTPRLLETAEKLYRDHSCRRDDARCKQFRERFSKEVRIHFLGVWDTVGALGVPGTVLSERKLFGWHDARLSPIVDRAYQALALDEHRAAYDAVLWTSADGHPQHPQQQVEQRWFCGAHANVGGGYGDDPLAELPLRWMQERALEAGLALSPVQPEADAHLRVAPTDSYAQFLAGNYARVNALFKAGDGRHHRRFDRGSHDEPAINVTIDPSVLQRYNAPGSRYAPPTLVRAGQIQAR